MCSSGSSTALRHGRYALLLNKRIGAVSTAVIRSKRGGYLYPGKGTRSTDRSHASRSRSHATASRTLSIFHSSRNTSARTRLKNLRHASTNVETYVTDSKRFTVRREMAKTSRKRNEIIPSGRLLPPRFLIRILRFLLSAENPFPQLRAVRF